MMETAALLKAIIDNAIDGIITIDDRGKIVLLIQRLVSCFNIRPKMLLAIMYLC